MKLEQRFERQRNLLKDGKGDIDEEENDALDEVIASEVKNQLPKVD